MRINEVKWSNYRRIPDGSILVRRHLVLIGPNDSGKSSVLRAIHLCLGVPGPQLSTAITERDFSSHEQPLVLQVVLEGFDDEDRATFPDEISTINGESLTLEVRATWDTAVDSVEVVRSFGTDGPLRRPSRNQLQQFRWDYVPATRSLIRELGTGSTSAVRELLSAVDLGEDRELFDAAATAFRSALDNSQALSSFRTDLAAALSDALPRAFARGDLSLTSTAELLEDPLADVTISVDDGGHQAPIAEQSDGIRAISLLTLLGMSAKSARIVGIDEPETHLHGSAQRSVAARLRASSGQQVIVTHSPAVVREMSPLDIVVMGPDRIARQLDEGADMAAIETITRHWLPQLIEPLTAKTVLFVEGPSDRILCERVADLLGFDLPRSGVSVFEMGGSGLFERAYGLFGPRGFNIPVFGLLDEDARADWAAILGLDPAAVEADIHYAVCDPDLEGVYIAALGVERAVELLLASPGNSEAGLLNSCGAASVAELTVDLLSARCRKKKHKLRSALAVTAGLTAEEAGSLGPIPALLLATVVA